MKTLVVMSLVIFMTGCDTSHSKKRCLNGFVYYKHHSQEYWVKTKMECAPNA
jgi:hypothetical protein